MAFVIVLFALHLRAFPLVIYCIIIIMSDCTYTLKINKVMHCDPDQSKLWQVWNVDLP